MLCAQNISKSYRGVMILDDVSVRLNERETVCLLGKSGVGKTTLFNILAGIDRPDGGGVFFKGEDITGLAGHVSYMPQKDLLMPYKTVLQNVSLPLLIKGQKKALAYARALESFDAFGLTGTEKLYPRQLSGGMCQRAALLRTYLFSHDAVLLDEPFSSLDALTKSAMHAWFLSLTARLPLAACIITHDIDEAILLADRIYVLSGAPGRISAEISVPAPRPRGDGFILSSDFLDRKKQIMNVLKKS